MLVSDRRLNVLRVHMADGRRFGRLAATTRRFGVKSALDVCGLDDLFVVAARVFFGAAATLIARARKTSILQLRRNFLSLQNLCVEERADRRRLQTLISLFTFFLPAIAFGSCV